LLARICSQPRKLEQGGLLPPFLVMGKSMQRLLTNAGTWLSRPWAVGAVILYAVLWMIFDRASLDWHGLVSLATLIMALFIQRAEHRDTQAIHAKLDELLRVNNDARSHLTTLDEREPEQVEAFRARAQGADGKPAG
jgi:low affinity Fe/Cu permease